MNVYEIKTMAERLAGNTYPGRGIVLGVTPDGAQAVAAYFIMGRSVNSRNRVFVREPDGIRTEAHDPSLMKDPHLIIYHPVREVGQEYPDIEIQERLVDAMCAKMMDPDFNRGIEVVVLPNLYGDIVTDVAAEHQGGLGTASSSNIGDRYALFEAIHGTAPGLCAAGKAGCANPCSLIRAMGQMLAHMGYVQENARLEKALDKCTRGEGAMEVGPKEGQHSAAEFVEYLIRTIHEM